MGMTVLRDPYGRYAVGLEHVCRCGHTKGSHLAGKRGASNGACIYDGSDDCGCQQFRLNRPARGDVE